MKSISDKINEGFFSNVVNPSDKICEAILMMVKKIADEIKRKKELPSIISYLIFMPKSTIDSYLKTNISSYIPTIREIEKMLQHAGDCELFTVGSFSYKNPNPEYKVLTGKLIPSHGYFHDANEKYVNMYYDKSRKDDYMIQPVDSMLINLIIYTLAGNKIEY